MDKKEIIHKTGKPTEEHPIDQMRNPLSLLPPTLFLLACGCLLCTPFAVDETMEQGVVMGKVAWLHMAVWVMGGAAFVGLLVRKRMSFRLQWADRLLAAYMLVVVCTYDWELHAEPEKLLVAGQLVCLWGFLRMGFFLYPSLRMPVIILLLATGCGEALIGWMQLYGWTQSYHSLFKLTGTFYNPGPYAGYLVLFIPLSLGLLLVERQKKIRTSAETLCYYFSGFSLLAILTILPAGMSRASWIAGILSGLFVVLAYGKTSERFVTAWQTHRKRIVRYSALAFFLFACTLPAAYYLKKDSADGRLLLWKTTAKAIVVHPGGVGLGGFPTAYAEAQAAYLYSDKASEAEKKVAGTPEYAFNEFLQIGLEQGIAGLLLFGGWLGLCLYKGIHRGRYGLAGTLLSLLLFALASYPLQLPSFWVVLVVLGALLISREAEDQERQTGTGMRLTVAGLFLLSALLYWQHHGYPPAYREWKKGKQHHLHKQYEAAYPIYAALYDRLNHRPEYLFEWSQCLAHLQRYDEANQVLERGMRLSADPMFRYVLAKNQQAAGQYETAEGLLIQAIHILPERIYPYYLLAKLYADPDFYQPEKMVAAADSVLFKVPKVESTAIKEMREELRKLFTR